MPNETVIVPWYSKMLSPAEEQDSEGDLLGIPGSPSNLQRLLGNQGVLGQLSLGPGFAGTKPPVGLGNQAALAWLRTNETGGASTGELTCAMDKPPEALPEAGPLDKLALAEGLDLKKATLIPDLPPPAPAVTGPAPAGPPAPSPAAPPSAAQYMPKDPLLKVASSDVPYELPFMNAKTYVDLLGQGPNHDRALDIYDKANHDLEKLPKEGQQVVGALAELAFDKATSPEVPEDPAKQEDKGRANKLSALLKTYEIETKKELRKTLSVPVGMGTVANLGVFGAVSLKLSAGPDWNVGAMLNDAALSAHIGYKIEASASATLGVSLGLGVGVPGLNAGIAGKLSATLTGGGSGSATLRGSLAEKTGADTRAVNRLVGEATAKIDASIFATGEIGPSIILGTKTIDWMIPMMKYNIADWGPKISTSLSTDGGFEAPELSDVDKLTLNVPEPGMEVARAIAEWITADNEAHQAVNAMAKDGALDDISSEERAALLAALSDMVVMDAHEGSMLALIRAEPDVEHRWRMLGKAYREEYGQGADRDTILAWLDSSIDNDLIGSGANYDELLRLLGR